MVFATNEQRQEEEEGKGEEIIDVLTEYLFPQYANSMGWKMEKPEFRQRLDAYLSHSPNQTTLRLSNLADPDNFDESAAVDALKQIVHDVSLFSIFLRYVCKEFTDDGNELMMEISNAKSESGLCCRLIGIQSSRTHSLWAWMKIVTCIHYWPPGKK